MKSVPYNDPILLERRRSLRKDQTNAEQTLWRALRNKQLAIELDGSQHAEDEIQQYDQERTDYLTSFEIDVLRFWNNEIFENLEGVLEKICEMAAKSYPLPPSPYPKGRSPGTPPLKIRGGRGAI